MGALQTSIPSVRSPVSALNLNLNVGRAEQARVDSSALKAAISDRAIGSNSVYEECVLVQQSIAGDSRSQEKLFAAHTARLYRTALSVLRNKEDAEDAVQDGLCSAYTKLGSFQGRSSFSMWLTRIVINSALMNRRRKLARPLASLDEILDNQEGQLARIVDLRPDPEEICRVIEINGLVEKEVQKLPAGIQRAFRLYELHGLSIGESIQALGISKNAFKSRIFRARRRVTEGLEGSLQASVHVVTAIGANTSKRSRQRRSNC